MARRHGRVRRRGPGVGNHRLLLQSHDAEDPHHQGPPSHRRPRRGELLGAEGHRIEVGIGRRERRDDRRPRLAAQPRHRSGHGHLDGVPVAAIRQVGKARPDGDEAGNGRSVAGDALHQLLVSVHVLEVRDLDADDFRKVRRRCRQEIFHLGRKGPSSHQDQLGEVGAIVIVVCGEYGTQDVVADGTGGTEQHRGVGPNRCDTGKGCSRREQQHPRAGYECFCPAKHWSNNELD
mmetsp:Transcript_12264/g.29123  ORF Transcript_12264/g.29123 Transcript_12264/m.29123 type:complete len:234 (+) Transcript_12264:3381-4082(+)